MNAILRFCFCMGGFGIYIVWGLVRYFVNTPLLVGLYISKPSYMAAGYNPPLRSGIHTMIGDIINNIH